jgi:hypothetical protein
MIYIIYIEDDDEDGKNEKKYIYTIEKKTINRKP